LQLLRGPWKAESEPVVGEAARRRVQVQVRDAGRDLRRRGGAGQGPGDSAQLILSLHCKAIESTKLNSNEVGKQINLLYLYPYGSWTVEVQSVCVKVGSVRLCTPAISISIFTYIYFFVLLKRKIFSHPNLRPAPSTVTFPTNVEYIRVPKFHMSWTFSKDHMSWTLRVQHTNYVFPRPVLWRSSSILAAKGFYIKNTLLGF